MFFSSFAYMEFADKDAVNTAMALDDSLFRGRQIKVCLSSIACWWQFRNASAVCRRLIWKVVGLWYWTNKITIHLGHDLNPTWAFIGKISSMKKILCLIMICIGHIIIKHNIQLCYSYAAIQSSTCTFILYKYKYLTEFCLNSLQLTHHIETYGPVCLPCWKFWVYGVWCTCSFVPKIDL